MEDTTMVAKTRAEYESIGKAASQELIDIIRDIGGWHLEKAAADNNGIKVETRKSTVGESDIIMTTCELDAPAKRVLAMVLPWLPYRLQFDDLLESTQVIDQVSESMYLVQHVTKKKMPLSARESIDVVTLGKEDDFYYVSSAGTSHPDFPIRPKYVRTHQYLGGYVIYPEENENQCTFKMFIHADLNIAGPKLMNNIVQMVKPKFMADKIKALKKALVNIPIDEAHIKCLNV
uniref:START domain-containing protein n=1 Tax=Plectus sambesii TaxID=2011161 RepID=A0A914V3C1_9BILA